LCQSGRVETTSRHFRAKQAKRVAGRGLSGELGASVQSSAELMRFTTMGDMGKAP